MAYYVITFVIGIFLAIQLAMNGAAGATAENFRMANGLFWCIGAITALCIAATGYEAGFWGRIRTVPLWYWAGGAMGGILLCVIAVLIVRMGAASFTAVVLAGQICGGLLIAHFGLMDTPVQHVSAVRLVGAIIMAIGATLAVYGKIPNLF